MFKMKKNIYLINERADDQPIRFQLYNLEEQKWGQWIPQVAQDCDVISYETVIVSCDEWFALIYAETTDASSDSSDDSMGMPSDNAHDLDFSDVSDNKRYMRKISIFTQECGFINFPNFVPKIQRGLSALLQIKYIQ